MADLQVVEELKAYLIAEGIAQHFGNGPSDPAPSQILPSITISPKDGAPQPRDGEDAVITLRDTFLGSPSSLESWIEEAFVEVIVRHRHAGRCKLVHRTIRGLIWPNDAVGGRKMWMMNDLLIEQSDLWRAEQELPFAADTTRGGATRLQTADRVQTFRFMCRRKSLAGEPYAP